MSKIMWDKMRLILNKFVNLFSVLLLFCVVVIVISPLIGTISEFFDFEWGWWTVFAILLISFFITITLREKNIFYIDNLSEFLMVILLLGGATIIYSQYSPVLELRQDPSIYMLKALNLINYGHLYSPAEVIEELVGSNILSIDSVEGYARIQNGIEYLNGRLYTDFYPGGTFFYAIVGMFSKNLIFYAQTAIMLVNVVLFYFVIKKLSIHQSLGVKIVLTATFFATPIIVWFGRGSFSEPFALFFVLLLITMLLQNNVPVWMLALTFCASYSSRIDYLLVMLIGVFVITFLSYKAGAVYTLMSCVEIFLFKEVYFIYYNRITTQDMPALKYGVVLVIVAFCISILIARYVREWIKKIYYSKSIYILTFLVGTCCALLMFRDNITPKYEYAEIHGQVIRTYVEEIVDLLFLVFPPFILIIGLFGIVCFIKEKEIPFLASVFMFGITIVYLYFLFAAGNSPQLYWMLRRYYNVILPMAFLGFILLMSRVEKKIMTIISVTCLLISVDMFLDSGQIPDYEGLDKSVVEADLQLENMGADVVFYDQDLRYEISSIMSFNSAEFIPVDFGNESVIEKLLKWSKNKETTNVVWMLSERYIDAAEEIKLTYSKMGEEYGKLPEAIYSNCYKMYLYRGADFKDLEKNTASIIYPNVRVEKCEGFYDDKEWTNGKLIIQTSGISTKSYKKLYVQMYDYRHYFLDNEQQIAWNVSAQINGKQLYPVEINKDYILFDISDLDVEIQTFEITCDTFNQKKLDIGDDERNLGIAIEKIYME